jgi:hypothetical protein
VLERHGDGGVKEPSPRTFLPELGIFVACTVVKRALTGRKRRKVLKTRIREGDKVEILFRRDIERLARRWRLPRLAAALSCEPEV